MTKRTFTVDYYDYEGQDSYAGIGVAGSTHLRLHVGVPKERPHEEFHLPEDAIVTGYTARWAEFPQAMEKIFCAYWGFKSPVLWINEHGPFPYSMGSVRFDASGVPIDHCPHCQEEHRKALEEPEWEVFV